MYKQEPKELFTTTLQGNYRIFILQTGPETNIDKYKIRNF